MRNIEGTRCQIAAAVIGNVLECAEAILIESALEVTRGRREEAAKMLGYGRNTVTRKISDLNRRSREPLQIP